MTENSLAKLKDSICELVSIAEDSEISREAFEMLDNAGADTIDCLDRLSEYEAIETVEQLNTLQQDYWKLNEMCKEYSAIGTIEDLRALKEKNEPKKPKQYEYFQHDYFCPSCGRTLAESVDDDCDLEKEMAGWCASCGQKLDWSE